MFLHGDAQADRSLRWAHMPYCRFCRDAAYITNCIHTINNYLHNKMFCPGQNMQQTFLKFVEIHFCLCQKYKIGFLHGKNRNQGKSFLPKNTIAYQNTLSKKSKQNVIKALPGVIKTSESNNLKGILWKYSIQTLKIADSI